MSGTAGRASLLTLLGAVLNAALAFVMVGIVSNTLGAESTGHFFLVVALFALVATALTLGTDTTLVRTASRLSAQGRVGDVWRTLRVVLTTTVTLSAAAAFVIWLLAGQIAALLGAGDNPALADTIRALVPFLPAAPVLAALLGTSRGMGQLYPYTLVQNIFVPVARVIGMLAVAAASAGVALYLTAWGAPLALAALMAGLVVLRLRSRHLSSDRGRAANGDVREFWRFSLPRGAAALVERGLEWVDVLLVLALAGPAAGGVYGVVRRLVSAGGLLEGTIRVVMGPRVSRALTLRDSPTAAALFQEGTGVLVLVSWPLYLTLIFFGAPILDVFGEEFAAGRTALVILAGALLIETGCGMLQTFLLMGGRSHWQLLNKSVQLIILVTLSLALIPHWGLVGAATAWFAGSLVNTAMSATQVYGSTGIRSGLGVVGVPVAVASASFGVVAPTIGMALGQGIGPALGALAAGGVVLVGASIVLRRRLRLISFWERT